MSSPLDRARIAVSSLHSKLSDATWLLSVVSYLTLGKKASIFKNARDLPRFFVFFFSFSVLYTAG